MSVITPATTPSASPAAAIQLSASEKQGVGLLQTLDVVIRAKQNGDTKAQVIKVLLDDDALKRGDPQIMRLVGYLRLNASWETPEQMVLLGKLLPHCGIVS